MPKCESILKMRGRWGQRAGPSAAREAVGKASTPSTVGSKVDAGVSNITLSPAFLQAIDALLQVGNISAARTLLAPFQRGEGE